MPFDLVIREGSVGSILSYVTGEVPSETGYLGRDKLKRKEAAASMQQSATPCKIRENGCSRDYAVERGVIQETIMTQAQYCMKRRFELETVTPGTIVLKAIVEKKA